MHRVLPDPALSLAFYCRRASSGTPIDPRLMIIGPKTRPHVFPFRGGEEIAAVRVKLEWSALLLDIVPNDHRDREQPLADVLPRLARELLGPLTETRSAGEAAGRLAELVVSRGRKYRASVPGSSAHALDLVRQAAGMVSVDGVARRMGVPSRTLRRSVRREAGLSLKEYARVTRFLRAVVIADRSSSPAWAAIAADAGFCDQSHLVRECRALTGLAPGQVHRERRAQAETSNTG